MDTEPYFPWNIFSAASKRGRGGYPPTYRKSTWTLSPILVVGRSDTVHMLPDTKIEDPHIHERNFEIQNYSFITKMPEFLTCFARISSFSANIKLALNYNAFYWQWLERVQKSAVKIILGTKYLGCENHLVKSLKDRREKLCLSFTEKCARNPKTQKVFPENKKKSILWKPETLNITKLPRQNGKV